MVLFFCEAETAHVLSLIVFLFPVTTSSFMIALFLGLSLVNEAWG